MVDIVSPLLLLQLVVGWRVSGTAVGVDIVSSLVVVEVWLRLSVRFG